MQNFIQSKFLHGILVGIAVLVVLLAVFEIGMAVGARKASHFSHWCQQNENMFAPPGPMGRVGTSPPDDTHGVFGSVVSASGTTMVVEGQDGMEHTVTIDGSTLVRSGQSNATSTDLHTKENVGVFGDPNDTGGIDAKLIRIFP